MSDEIPEVEGLDVHNGLVRLGGNRSLYLKLLRQFLDLSAVPDQLAAALSSNDFRTAERLAHTLQGTAATLGVESVRAPAYDLETALRAGAQGLGELEAQTRIALEDFLVRLREALPEESRLPAEPTPVIDAQKAAEAVESLDGLLREFDASAASYVEAHRSLFAALLGTQGLESLQAQLHTFSFPQARESLAKLPLGYRTSEP